MEGTTELNEATFSSEGLAVNFSRTADFKAKEGDGHARRRAGLVLPAREGEVAQSAAPIVPDWVFSAGAGFGRMLA